MHGVHMYIYRYMCMLCQLTGVSSSSCLSVKCQAARVMLSVLVALDASSCTDRIGLMRRLTATLPPSPAAPDNMPPRYVLAPVLASSCSCCWPSACAEPDPARGAASWMSCRGGR
jgi:hypothetical protein